MKCLNDGVEFEAKRKTAKFCSPKCRVEYARKEGIDMKSGEVSERRKVANRIADANNKFSSKLKTVESENPFERVDDDYDTEKALKAFKKMGLKETSWVSTGIDDFDELTQIPRGRITQIQGPYGVGKTTLCLNMIRGLRGKRVLYIDSEVSLNPHLLVALRLDPAKFDLYNDSAYFEDIAEVIKTAVKTKKYDMIIFDSLAATTTKAEAEGDITASNIGQKAKMMHKLIHIIAQDLKENDIAFVVINQEREMIGTYVPTKYTPGGNAVPYAASLIVALKTIKSWRFPKSPKDGLYLGHEVEATIIKSKVNDPWRTKKFKLYYPKPVAQPVEDDTEPAF